MQRATRLLVELLAIAGIWILWDWRAAATLLILLLLAGVLIPARRAPGEPAGEIPTLRTPAAGAAPSGPARPGSGRS